MEQRRDNSPPQRQSYREGRSDAVRADRLRAALDRERASVTEPLEFGLDVYRNLLNKLVCRTSWEKQWGQLLKRPGWEWSWRIPGFCLRSPGPCSWGSGMCMCRKGVLTESGRGYILGTVSSHGFVRSSWVIR